MSRLITTKTCAKAHRHKKTTQNNQKHINTELEYAGPLYPNRHKRDGLLRNNMMTQCCQEPQIPKSSRIPTIHRIHKLGVQTMVVMHPRWPWYSKMNNYKLVAPFCISKQASISKLFSARPHEGRTKITAYVVSSKSFPHGKN